MSDAIGLVIIFTIAVSFVLVINYNSFIKYRNMIEEAWSGIDTALKRRANLIPNLVNVVKGYRKHESDTLQQMTDSRVGSKDVVQRGSEESRISKSLGGLIAVAEAYPDLKASENFTLLQQALVEVEEEIQKIRREYNHAVRKYNTQVESFPGNLMAGVFKFTRAEYFTLELVTQRQVPDIGFD